LFEIQRSTTAASKNTTPAMALNISSGDPNHAEVWQIRTNLPAINPCLYDLAAAVRTNTHMITMI
jgi:hypothetical protein